MTGYLADKGVAVFKNGYNVIPIRPGDKAPSIKDWRGKPTTEADIKRWIGNGRAGHGVGITTDTTPLVDIDIFDPAMNRRMVAYVEFNVGYAPIRVGNAPKCGMLFRSETPFRKISSRAFTDPQGRKAQIEILGVGEQFVAYHIHPDTHKPYRWLGAENPEVTPAADLPELTQEQGQAICREFERIATEFGWQPWKARTQLPALTADDDPFSLSSEPLGLSDDELTEIVRAIPNEGVIYDEWLNIGMAIHHETGASEFGRSLWLEWSEQNLKHEDEKFEKSWGSIGKTEETRRLITARYLIKLSKEARQAATAEQVDELIRRMDFAADLNELRGVTADCRKLEVDLIDRSRLVNAFQRAVKAKSNTTIAVREAREMIRYRPDDSDMPEWLLGWCYLKHSGLFYNGTTGERITRDAFDAGFGRLVGDTSAAKFALDAAKIPVYHMTLFLPGADETFTDANGLEWINTYNEKSLPPVPANWNRRDLRNVEIVENHFYHLFSDEREIGLFASWLAYIVQSRKRPNWAIVMQGAQSSGKTFFAQLMSAVGVNVYILGTDTLQNSTFTSWAEGHQLVFIEELKLHGHNRYDILNKLKPYITNSTAEIHPKGVNPYNVPNVTAYLAATNYRDALPLDANESRYMIMMSRWQSKEAIDEFRRSDPAYYPNLFSSINESPGSIRRWLLEYPLTQAFDPDDRAPFSHGRDAMIEYTKSDEDIQIQDLIDSGKHPLISNDFIAVNVLRETLLDETGIGEGLIHTSRGVRNVLTGMGFAPLKRLRIGEDRFYLWSRNHGIINASDNTIRNLFSGAYRAQRLPDSDL